MDARTSDAIALAVRVGAPILIYESILEKECLHMPEEEKERQEKGDNEGKEAQEESIEALQDALERAIKSEDYELAAKLRDQIRLRNQNQ